MHRQVAAEFLGTMMLVAVVVGSGIMGAALSADTGVTLLINAVSTVAGLGVLIWTLGPISGAHFNPAVTLVAAFQRELPGKEGVLYVGAQLVGGFCGAVLANLMFDLPAIELATNERAGGHLLLGEVVATAGLIFVIGALTRTGNSRLGPVLVAAWIGAAYFFTSSTSFANPAVTFSRMFTDTFTGIAPGNAPAFIASQLVGAAVGAALTAFFFPRRGQIPEPLDLPEAAHQPPRKSP